jgi:hypothetical protein
MLVLKIGTVENVNSIENRLFIYVPDAPNDAVEVAKTADLIGYSPITVAPVEPKAAPETARFVDLTAVSNAFNDEMSDVLEFNCVPEAPMAAVDVARTAD